MRERVRCNSSVVAHAREFFTFGVLGLVLLFHGCASLGGSPRDTAGKAIIAAEAAYHVAVEAELSLRCGQPTALPGHCISPQAHARFKAILLEVYFPGPPKSGYLQEAHELYALLPTEGTPSTAQIFALISKIGEIVREVIAGLPRETPKAVAAAGDENVVKTIQAVK